MVESVDAAVQGRRAGRMREGNEGVEKMEVRRARLDHTLQHGSGNGWAASMTDTKRVQHETYRDMICKCKAQAPCN